MSSNIFHQLALIESLFEKKLVVYKHTFVVSFFWLQTKCERYWPDPTFKMQEKYGDIVVTFDSAIGRDGYQITSLYISDSQSLEAPRRVYHYWYTAWPDHGVPDSPRQFLRLVEEVHIAQEREDVKEGPVVVHCRLVHGCRYMYFIELLSLLAIVSNMIVHDYAIEREIT